MDKRPINPYAIGAQFLDYCVKQGWLREERNGRSKRWFATEEGEIELKKFGIEVILEKNAHAADAFGTHKHR